MLDENPNLREGMKNIKTEKKGKHLNKYKKTISFLVFFKILGAV